MKKLKILSAILLCMIIAALPAVSAYALTPEEGLEVEITANKDSFRAAETVTVTVTVKNISDKYLMNVSSGAHSTDYLPVKGEKTFGRTEMLEPGETMTYSFKAVLSPKIDGLGFFDKLLLFIKGLFIQTDMFPLTGIRDIYTVNTSKTFNHSGITTEFGAYALFGEACDTPAVPEV